VAVGCALAVLAIVSGWTLPGGFGLANLLEQARPAGTEATATGGFVFGGLTYPAEHDGHAPAIHATATMTAFSTAPGRRRAGGGDVSLEDLSPRLFARLFKPAYAFLANRWYVDELYHAIFVVPALGVAKLAIRNRSRP